MKYTEICLGIIVLGFRDSTHFLRDPALEIFSLFDECGDAVGGFGVAFEEDPAIVIHAFKEFNQLLLGVLCQKQGEFCNK